MSQPLGILKGDAHQKIAGVGFISGAILFGISGLLMPHATTPTGDLQEMLKPLGEYEFLTITSSLLMTLGFWVAMIGMSGVSRSITASGAAWARVGFYSVLVGTALWTVCMSLDVGTAGAVATWLAVPVEGKEAAWSVVAALSAFGRGLIPLTWVVYWLALAFLGIAMILSTAYPRWLGRICLTLAVPTIALGIVQTFNARSITLTLMFSVLMLATALWDLATGIWIARRAW